MADVNKDEVAEKLQRALETTSTPEEKAEETPIEEAGTEEKEEGGEENRVPQKRFNEINDALKATKLVAQESQDQLVEHKTS